MNPLKTELLRGTLDMLILKIVALGPSHGYAVAQRLRQISNAGWANFWRAYGAWVA